MSRKTWRDLARQQQTAAQSGPAAPPVPSRRDEVDLASVAEQVPALQSLLDKRKALESHMQSLGAGGPGPAPGSDPRFPVASMAERRAELQRWAQQHEQRQHDPSAALDQRPRQAARDSWQQLRDAQTGQALERARGLVMARQDLMQRLDQRVSDARNKARQRLRESRDQAIQAPITRPLDKPLSDRLDAPMGATRSERATTAQGFDQRYQQRMDKLLGVRAGSTDELAARRERQREQQREQLREQRLEARRAERQEERQNMMKRERARERRAQRPQLSTD